MSWQSEGFYKRPLLIRTAFDMIDGALAERGKSVWAGYDKVLRKRNCAAFIALCIAIQRSGGSGVLPRGLIDPTQLDVFPGVPLTSARIEAIIGFPLFSADFNLTPFPALGAWLNRVAAALSTQYVYESFNRPLVQLVRTGTAEFSEWSEEAVNAAYQSACSAALTAEPIWKDYTRPENYTYVDWQGADYGGSVTVTAMRIYLRATLFNNTFPGGAGTAYYKTEDPRGGQLSDWISAPLSGAIIDDPDGLDKVKYFADYISDYDDFQPLPDFDYDQPPFIGRQYNRGVVIDYRNCAVRFAYDFKYK